MSKPVKPESIGLFLLGGIGLLVLALLTFGGGEIFKTKLNWVVFFDSSLNGLNIGAPVKVQGVQVGVVKEIELQLDDSMGRLMKPVVIEIDPARVVTSEAHPVDINAFSAAERERDFQKLIGAGLRARLEVQSILTGLLYVNLDFDREHLHDQPPHFTGLNYKGLPEVPSVPPTVDEVLATLENVLKKVGTLPIDDMFLDLAATLKEIRQLVASDEARRSQVALSHSLQSAEVILKRLEKQLPELVAHLEATSMKMRDHATPILSSTEATLESSKVAAGNIADMTDADSGLQASIKQMDRAATSLRELSDYLQRHPESLLFGKTD